MIYGLVPAVRLSCTDITSVLKDDTPGGGARTSRLRSALVIAQIAVAVVLLVGTALILRTMREAQRANAGFEPQHVTWVSFDMRGGGHDEPRGRILYSRLLDAVRADPDVIDASLAAWLPLTLFDWMSWNATPQGYQPRRDESRAVSVNAVSRGYFRTLGIPVLAGREFDATDDTCAEWRLIVNDTFARRFWGSAAAAIGRRVETGGKTRTVVGVVRDIKYARLDEAPRPYMYVPAAQVYSASMTLQVRARRDPAVVVARIREHAAALDSSLAILQSGTMGDTLRSATSIYETLARMLTLIGGLGVIISALGVYGLVAYSVKQQAHAIGVRTALGAPRRLIVRQYVQDGAWLAAIGTLVGVLFSLAFGRLMSTLLFGVASTGVASFAGATLVVVGSALLASIVPAWRAVARDPIAALRHQ